MVRRKLTREHISLCGGVFTPQEVEDALFQMSPLEAPGLDGLPAFFFQKYLHIVGPEVRQLVLDVLNNNRDPSDLNTTLIVLIPKCKNPSTPKYFRPISICIVVMKMVSKTIAN